MLYTVAGALPIMLKQRIAKEYTEYSEKELAELTEGGAPQQLAHAQASDDFRTSMATECSPVVARKVTAPPRFCKEFSEFSEEELAMVTIGGLGGLDVRRQTSDDFQSTDLSESAEAPPSEADTDEHAESPGRLIDGACRCYAATFCKEHSEYSQQELDEISEVPLRITAVSDAKVCSDDFCGCLQDFALKNSNCATSPAIGPLCKELTEYSLRELAEILEEGAVGSTEATEGAAGGSAGGAAEAALPDAGTGGVGAAEVDQPTTSDDFFQPASTFASFYHRNCMSGTGEHVTKHIRRVYHNRRKTAWTDYDENGKVIPQDGDEAADSGGAKAEAAEADARPPALVRLLKGEGEDGGVPIFGAQISRAQVREVAMGEATEKRIAVAKVLEATGPCGWTPLLIAVQRKQIGAVRALLELGAELESKEPTCGWTPLMYAAQTGKKELVSLLLAKGAKVNACSMKHRWSPLCSAIQSGSEEVVHQLLAAGADLQAVKKQHPAIADTYRQDMAQFQGQQQAKPPSSEASKFRTDYSQSC